MARKLILGDKVYAPPTPPPVPQPGVSDPRPCTMCGHPIGEHQMREYAGLHGLHGWGAGVGMMGTYVACCLVDGCACGSFSGGGALDPSALGHAVSGVLGADGSAASSASTVPYDSSELLVPSVFLDDTPAARPAAEPAEFMPRFWRLFSWPGRLMLLFMLLLPLLTRLAIFLLRPSP